MDKEELNKKLKEFDRDFVSVHLGDFEIIKMIHKRIIGYSKSGMSMEKIYEGFIAKEIIKNISLSAFKKEVRKLKNVQKDSFKNSSVRVKKVSEGVPLIAKEEPNKADSNVYDRIFENCILKGVKQNTLNFWLTENNHTETTRKVIGGELAKIPDDKKKGDMFENLKAKAI